MLIIGLLSGLIVSMLFVIIGLIFFFTMAPGPRPQAIATNTPWPTFTPTTEPTQTNTASPVVVSTFTATPQATATAQATATEAVIELKPLQNFTPPPPPPDIGPRPQPQGNIKIITSSNIALSNMTTATPSGQKQARSKPEKITESSDALPAAPLARTTATEVTSESLNEAWQTVLIVLDTLGVLAPMKNGLYMIVIISLAFVGWSLLVKR